MNTEREALPITLKQLEIIIEALTFVYERSLRKNRDKKRYIPKTPKEIEKQAKQQEVLQYLLLSRNIFAGTLNPAIEAAIGEARGMGFILNLLTHINNWIGYDSPTKEHFIFLEEDNSKEDILAGKYTFRIATNESETTDNSSGLSELSGDEKPSTPVA